MRKCAALIIYLLIAAHAFCQGRDTNLALTRLVPSYDVPHIKLPVADFKTDSVAFTIALFDANNDSVWSTPETDMIIVAPYKADTVYTHIGCQATLINWHKQAVVKVKNKEYRITAAGYYKGTINVRPMNNYVTPDATLFDHIPNDTISLISGKTLPLASLLDKNKYTYVLFWGMWCQPCMQSLEKMKGIYDTYKDKVTLISMDFADADTAALHKLITTKGYTWPQAISTERVNEAFSQSGYPYGVLFAPDGSLVKQGISVQQLPLYISPKRGDLNSQKQ